MNKIFLVGNLTRDPELSTTPNGIPVCKFAVAVNRHRAKQEGNSTETADFFNLVVWRQVGENCAKYLKKGNKVAICGSVQNRTYEQDGVKKFYSEVVADDVEFLTPKGGHEGGSDGEMRPLDDALPF